MSAQILWTGDDVALAVRGRGPTGWQAQGVAIDSRAVKPGDLFIALRGPVYDGHDFVGQALENGAVAAIVHTQPQGVPNRAALLMVEDTFNALQDLGSVARQRSQAQIIGVTGSVGKTSCKEQLALMLGALDETYANEGSFNNHWGVPLSLARLPEQARYGIFELGMNHAGELGPLSRLVQPHVALITSIEAVHLEFFNSTEAIADAKAEIFLGMNVHGAAVLNRDNPHYARLMAAARTQGLNNILGFGRAKDADARLIDCKLLPSGSRVTAEIMGDKLTYEIGTPGIHLVMNSLGTLLAAHAAGADINVCAGTLVNYQPPKGRGARERIGIDGGSFTLIDESYNASPVATRAAIEVLGQSLPPPGGRRIAIFGDMRELGPTAPQLHASLAEPLIQAKVDTVYCCGHLMQALFEALPQNMRGRYVSDSATLAKLLPGVVRPNDIVMVKGSKSVRMDLVINALRGMGQTKSAAD